MYSATLLGKNVDSNTEHFNCAVDAVSYLLSNIVTFEHKKFLVDELKNNKILVIDDHYDDITCYIDKRGIDEINNG